MTVFLIAGTGLAAALAVAAQSMSTGGDPVATAAAPQPTAAVAELAWPPEPEAATATIPGMDSERDAGGGAAPLPMLVAEIVATDPDGAAADATVVDIPPLEEGVAVPADDAQGAGEAVAPLAEVPRAEAPLAEIPLAEIPLAEIPLAGERTPAFVETAAAPSGHPGGPEHLPLPRAGSEGDARVATDEPDASATPQVDPGATAPAAIGPGVIEPAELEAAVEAVIATGIRAPLATEGAIAPTLRPSAAEQRLAECLVTAQTQPDQGLVAAREWETEGGGAFARRCLATALMGSGDAPAAARIFEDLAREIAILDPQRAVELFRRAGEAWLVAGRPMSAHGIATEGLKTGRDDPGLLIVRATASMALSDLSDALAALDRALAGEERAPQLLVMRATVLATAGRVADALADTEAALAELPDNVDALLLRGRLRLREGDVDAAIADWRRVVEVSREGPAARQASEALARVGAEP